MHNLEKPRKLKGLREYLAKTLKFYELKNERLTRVIFLIILAISFSSALVPEESSLVIPINLVGITLVFLASAVYLAAFLKDMKGEEYNISTCFRLIINNLFKIIVSSFTFIGTFFITLGIIVDPMFTSILVLILSIPLIVIYIMFLFNTCFIIDKQKGVVESFQDSRRVTSGFKRQIFLKLLGFNFFVGLPAALILVSATASGNILAANFVVSFVAAILNIMQQRLTALIYMDLEYGEHDVEKV